MGRVNDVTDGVISYLHDATTVRPNTNPPLRDGRSQPEFWYPRDPWAKIDRFDSAIMGEFGVIHVRWSQPPDARCIIVLDSARFPHDINIGVDNTITQLEFFFEREGWHEERLVTITDSTSVICSKDHPINRD